MWRDPDPTRRNSMTDSTTVQLGIDSFGVAG
jgi:hypothetical protein